MERGGAALIAPTSARGTGLGIAAAATQCRRCFGGLSNGAVNDEALAKKLSGLDVQQRAEARAQHGKAASVRWRSAGFHKDESSIWRGGVAVGSSATREAGGATVGVCISGQREGEVVCGCGVRP